jgi:glycosyltransferase involved in cell wall biosynthesis
MIPGSRRHRVLHTITTLPLVSGAAENTKLTLNLLDRNRFEPFLATQPGQPMDAEVAPDVVRIPLHWLGRALHPVADLCAFAELVSVIRRFRFDVVHTHNAKDGILGRWAARLAGTPAIIHTIHNISFQASANSLVNGMYEWQERWVARITDRFLAVSSENASKYLQKGIGRVGQYRTVYSGLDLLRYADDGRPAAAHRTTLGLPNRPGPWVGWVGRFNPQKDPLTFVRAARVVASQFPGAQFVVCGDDPLGASLERAARDLAAQLGLSEAMHFLGFRRDVVSVLRSVDVVMHSSRYEGMGRVICEALACERPVAGTAVDGVVEAIVSGERGGLLVAPGDATALGTAVCRLLADAGLARRLARAGCEWVHEHLSAESMVRDIEATYLELLELESTRPSHPRAP